MLFYPKLTFLLLLFLFQLRCSDCLSPPGLMPSTGQHSSPRANRKRGIEGGEKEDRQKEQVSLYRVTCYISMTSQFFSSFYTVPTSHKLFFTTSQFIVSSSCFKATAHSLRHTLSEATRYSHCLATQGSNRTHIAAGNEMPYLEGNLWCLCCCWGAKIEDLLRKQKGLHPALQLLFLLSTLVHVCMWGL